MFVRTNLVCLAGSLKARGRLILALQCNCCFTVTLTVTAHVQKIALHRAQWKLVCTKHFT